MNGLVISAEKFRTLTPTCQSEVLKALGLGEGAVRTEDQAATVDELPTKLSVAQAKEFWTGLSAKTRDLVKAVVEEPPKFNVGKVLKKIGLQPSELRGMLAGITKRIRTVTGNQKAYFFESEVVDN